MALPSAAAVNQELAALGETVPDVPDHGAEMGETGVAGERGVADELPGGQRGDGGTPG